MVRKVRQIRRKGKDVDVVPVTVRTAPDVDTRVALIQALTRYVRTGRSRAGAVDTPARLD